MPRPHRDQFPGAFYHVMSRGNDKQNIYLSTCDKERFLNYLKSATLNYDAIIHCYCLMENHYHLLIETPTGNIARIMQFINGAYTTYFNLKWSRIGHLFQGRYKSIVVDNDEYFLELSRYIHLNPVKSGLVEVPEKYRWSSYLPYICEASGHPNWLKRDFLLKILSETERCAIKGYKRFVEDKMNKNYSLELWE